MEATTLDDENELRPLLFSIAYRMTGSVAEAEDLVQEAFFRMGRARRSGAVVESPKAYLTATTTRLSINYLRSARARRESYVGTWLPEPLVGDLSDSPEQMAELSDTLSMAFLLLLESLSPVERAVFLLREVFDYPYEDIAQIVGKSEDNCRQIFARARRRVDSHQARFQASREQSEALSRSFMAAVRDGDLGQLVDLLAADATFYGDGGGKATSVAEPLHGRDKVAEFLLTVFGRVMLLGVTLEPVLVNGGPGVMARDGEGNVVSVMSLEVLDGTVQTLRSVVNPDKLGHLGPVSDFLRLRPE
ncbi:MAG TPA: RNA polymerase sigma-70 factor [Acidimicrobiales bacterium]|nr:RNA polymerase sigma-70 factor [Acidimicrobiales bacterium]